MNKIHKCAAAVFLAFLPLGHTRGDTNSAVRPHVPPTPSLPPVQPLFDHPVRDTSICLAPDGTYYLTGTTANNTGGPDDTNSWWWVNEKIRIWKSRDLAQWEPLGLVWSLEKDATWAREFKPPRSTKPQRAVWAPEIHYLKGTFWLAYSMNYGGCGLLKSTSGKAAGPYVDVNKDGPLTGQIDASLFQDTDGKVYWVYQDGKIARMTDDMTGLAEKPRLLKPANDAHVGFEGAFLTKCDGKYILTCAGFVGSRYNCMSAVSTNIYGPYGDRYLAIPHGGHNMLFKRKDGQWMSTFFGTDSEAIFMERPAILPIEINQDGHIRPLMRTAALNTGSEGSKTNAAP